MVNKIGKYFSLYRARYNIKKLRNMTDRFIYYLLQHNLIRLRNFHIQRIIQLKMILDKPSQ